MKLDEKIKLFCDGSVNPQKKIGFAAYFFINENEEFDEKSININLKLFENTSSTKLELQSLLWAFENKSLHKKHIEIYTDCQNIISLLNRREKLGINDFKSSSGKTIKNIELYKKFYNIFDEFNCTFFKVKGHKKSSLKNENDKLFNLVDKASRKALREYIN